MKIRIPYLVFAIGVTFALLLSACGSGEAIPTVDVTAVYTYAAMTIAAAETGTAWAMPTATFTPMPTNTMLPSPTVASVGPTSPPAAAASPDNSAFVKDVTVPDGTIVDPGKSFTKTWLVSNTGTSTWTPTYKLGFGFGEAMSGAATPIGKTVAPGEQVEVSVQLTVPSKSGDLTGNWRLFNDKGEAFGTFLSVVIHVNAVSAATATEEAEPTETFTATP